MKTIHFLLAGIQKTLLEGLGESLGTIRYAETGAAVPNAHGVYEMSRAFKPDVAAVDMKPPGEDGIRAVKAVLAGRADCKAIVIAESAEKTLLAKALESGAKGYLIHEYVSATLETAVRRVLDGGIYLPPEFGGILLEEFAEQFKRPPAHSKLSGRENEVLRRIADGMTAKEIGGDLKISSRTVEVHRRSIMLKLNLQGTAQLTKYAIRAGLTSLGESGS